MTEFAKPSIVCEKGRFMVGKGKAIKKYAVRCRPGGVLFVLS